MPLGPAAPESRRTCPPAPSEPARKHSQHQVAALQLAAVQGSTREVRLLWGSLPVLKRCLRWGLEHLIWVCGQLLVEDTFLSKHAWSVWEA